MYQIWNNILVIHDQNRPGKKSVTNDIENVLALIFNELKEHDVERLCNLNLKKVIYRDSDGLYDEVVIDANRQFVEFKAIRTPELSEALKEIKNEAR